MKYLEDSLKEFHAKKYGFILEQIDKDISNFYDCDISQFSLSKEDKQIFKSIKDAKIKREINKKLSKIFAIILMKST